MLPAINFNLIVNVVVSLASAVYPDACTLLIYLSCQCTPASALTGHKLPGTYSNECLAVVCAYAYTVNVCVDLGAHY